MVVHGADALWCWSRQLWDPAAGLVANPPGGYDELGPFAGRYLIRETAWFALSALDHGEIDLAAAALATVLGRQYDRAGKAWHGTFPIFDHDPEPGDDAIMWLSYDPNWRQFVGVALALILDAYAGDLPPALVGRCETAVQRCVAGEPPGRIPPSYTNPALMHAWLSDWAGRRFGRRAWAASGQALAGEVMALFDAAGALSEFNSPTYDGVNLMAATLWASAPPPLRGWGRRLVDSLAAALDFLYHPGLHNLCGPYSRSYGMDLGSRLTLYGLWRLVALGDGAALPPVGEDVVEHSHDLFFAPLAAWAAARCPRGFPAGSGSFPRQRTFDLGGGRQATAHLERSFMIGAERGGRSGLVWDQYVPGTLHWRSRGRLHWLRVHAMPTCPVDCRVVDGRVLEVAAVGEAPVVITTNAAVQAPPPGPGGARVRLGDRVLVGAAGALDLAEGPFGVRITAHHRGSPVLVEVAGSGS